MQLPALIEIPLRLLALMAGLLVPGSMVLRALRLPWSLAAAFVISATTLYVAVLIFACTGAPISWVTLAGALGVVALIGRLIPTRISSTIQPSSFACFFQMGPWSLLYLAFWIVVFYRLAFQPLTGPDVYFRWSYLAEQMLRFGTLDFYPPRSGADFVRYFWSESIPPGIASLYAWAYACGGDKQALWTSPVIALQLLSLHELIWRLAHRWGGELVARRAVLFAAACPLLTWSFLIGQETGMTAVAVAGMVWCLQNSRERGGRRWIILAGIFAIAAASTREYGPIFAVVAVLATLFMRLPRKHTLLLALVALPLALAWPARVWILTGNPFYSLAVGGIFPTNAVFKTWSEMFHQNSIKIFSQWADWASLVRYLLIWALPATIGLGALIFLLIRQLREARLVALFVGLAVALWAISVAHTAGGLFYSLRVLSPAFALLAVGAGYALSFLVQREAALKVSAFLIALMSLDALPKTLVLPENPYQLAPKDWAYAGRQFSDAVRSSEREIRTLVSTLPGKGRVLTDNAGLPRVLSPIRIQAIPLWSPEVSWLFEKSTLHENVLTNRKSLGFSYLIIGKGSPAADFIRTQMPATLALTAVIETDSWQIFEARIGTENDTGQKAP